ncbi:Transglutaminase-like superfamily protein [Thermoclostridium caenicola]|uniref:Transglutaminase-like superfamily protein n=1 Tax=Thermoclostridium caenicola TaxID=659425 RepID=A0A1M6FCZ8_9FIRM|nr:Transglutaminase-like superfamily protein [Thermoclostridium caenicola]
MSYRYAGFRQCQRCGSYIPINWKHCGRCGHPAKRRSGGWGWAFFVLLVFAAFLYRAQIAQWVQGRFMIPDREDVTPGKTAGQIPAAEPFRPETPETSFRAGNNSTAEPVASSGLSPDMAGDTGLDRKTGAMTGERKEATSLTYGQKIERIHTLIREALKDAREQVSLPVLGTENDSEIIFDIIEQIVLEDPEIMFYEGCRYRSDGQLTLRYSKSRDEVLSAVQATSQRADEIIAAIIEPGMTDFEKELAIHDYIVNNCRYDIENQRKGSTPPEAYTAYGVLVNGSAVCEGYAKAMKLLLDRVNIRSLVVVGYSKGNAHAWNMVCLDGQYYHVDTTWDDPVMAGGSQVLTHVYFNLADHEIQKDHSWDKAAYPQCVDTLYNYYHYYGLTVASPDEFSGLVGAAVADGRDHLSLRILDYDTGGYDIPRLIQNTANAWGIRGLTYSVNDAYGVVDIWVR